MQTHRKHVNPTQTGNKGLTSQCLKTQSLCTFRLAFIVLREIWANVFRLITPVNPQGTKTHTTSLKYYQISTRLNFTVFLVYFCAFKMRIEADRTNFGPTKKFKSLHHRSCITN